MTKMLLTDNKRITRFTRVFLCVTLLFILLSSTCAAVEPIKDNPGARGAVVMDADSGRVLFGHNPDVNLPMASTTKIMTAIIAVESGKMDEMVKISSNAAGTEGSSLYLKAGQIIKLEDLVYGLMLRSGNDCGVAIAEYLAGSVDNFASLMNMKAKEIGALNTNFTNPHGLHHSKHYTTAYDLALITRYGLSLPKFKEIFSSKHKIISWNESEKLNIVNKNKTLWQYDGGDGGKTGYTKNSGRCLVTTATRDNFQLIAVVLDCPDWFNECYNLMDYGFENYNVTRVIKEDQFVKNIPVKDGDKGNVSLLAQGSIVLPLGRDEIDNVELTYNLPDSAEAPISKGQIIGRLQVSLPNGKFYKTINLISKEDINKKTLSGNIKDMIIRWIDKGI